MCHKSHFHNIDSSNLIKIQRVKSFRRLKCLQNIKNTFITELAIIKKMIIN